MPGLKRKATQLPSVKKDKRNGKRHGGARREAHLDDGDGAFELQADSDSFDDDEDLMAGALAQSSNEETMHKIKQVAKNGADTNDNHIAVDMHSDEDMEGGFEDVLENVEAQAGPSRVRNQKSLYAIPSRDEMSALKNTNELYKSNILKLKVEEMVNQIKPKYDSTESLDYVVRRIKAIVEALPEVEAERLKKALKKIKRSTKGKGVSVPFPQPDPDPDSNVKFGFAAPTRVQLVGSWILKTAALRPEGADVDVVLTMPSSLFQEKDYMNMRYFHKRAFYLAVIASAISEHESELGLKCEYLIPQDDSLRPILVLKAVKGGATDFTKSKAFIKIHLTHEEEVFPIRRLSPSRNNVRVEGLEEAKQPPTPFYNACILADGLFSQHLLYLNATSQMCPSFSEACLLLKTWSLQRSFGSGPSKEEMRGRIGYKEGRRIANGANGMRFILTMLLAHLLHGSEKSVGVSARSKLSPGFSSYQLFRGTIDFLATHNFSINPIFMRGINGLVSRRDSLDGDDFKRHSKYVIVDPTGSFNLLQNVDFGTFDLLQAEARVTMSLLNDPEEDYFDELFLTRRWRPNFSFDEVLTVDIKRLESNANLMANLGSHIQVAIHQISHIIARALDTRATMVVVFVPSSSHWSVSETRPKESFKIEIGIMLNPQQAFRLVDHGPRPEDQAAAEEFKAFWGEIAELRRFRDGRIVESVVWSVDGVIGKYEIPRMILRHVLPRHCNIGEDGITFHSEAFNGLLEPNAKLIASTHLAMPKQGGFQTIQTTFDDLVKQMGSLEDLPLSIISIVGAESGLRGMSVMVPCPINRNANIPLCSSYLAIHDFVITLESSGRWPDDLVAIQAMKMAFYEAMARKLQQTLPSCQAHVVMDVDADANKYWDCSSLEIILSSGFAFRGRIHHERERTLLHRILDKAEEQHEKSMAKSALKRFETRFDHNVRHHNHMAALAHRFVSLSSAVRLFKRWLSCQMFGLDVPESLSELIVASVYIQDSKGGMIPSSGHTGFIQALQRVAEWSWREEPLMVAMTGATSATPTSTLPSELKSTVNSNFEQIRRLDPGLNHFAWFIATDTELKGCNWVRSHPCSGTADAIQKLASAACNILSAGPYLSHSDIKSIFMPSLRHYDFLIHLNPRIINRYMDNIAFDEKHLEIVAPATNDSISGMPLSAGLDTGRDFALLLESLYLDSMRFYYDTIGGCIIGGLFNPSLSKPRPFRVGLGFNSILINDTSKEVILNKDDIIAEIERLGKGIVERIETRS